jgi:hypothetical protein
VLLALGRSLSGNEHRKAVNGSITKPLGQGMTHWQMIIPQRWQACMLVE